MKNKLNILGFVSIFIVLLIFLFARFQLFPCGLPLNFESCLDLGTPPRCAELVSMVRSSRMYMNLVIPCMFFSFFAFFVALPFSMIFIIIKLNVFRKYLQKKVLR